MSAIDLYWVGLHKTPDRGLRIAARSTASGVLTLTVEGQSQTVTVDTAVNDGVVALEVGGLDPGVTYPYVLRHSNGDEVSGSSRTIPNGPYDVAWGSCWRGGTNVTYTWPQMQLADVVAFHKLGDSPYTDTASPGYGETSVSAGDLPLDVENYYKHHRRFRRDPLGKALASKTPEGYVPDDHEWPGDNWDHSIYQAQGGNTNIADISIGLGHVPSQAEVDATFWAGNQAFTTYALGNPRNTDEGVIAEKPSSAEAGTPTAHYMPHYFSWAAGYATHIMLDCISHRSPKAATDDAAKTMLGSVQKAWLKAKIADAYAQRRMILIYSPKKLFNAPTGVDNGDTWHFYSTERDEILNWIRDNGITGVIWLVGDRHTPSIEVARMAEGAPWDVVCVNPCPSGVKHNPVGQDYGPYTRFLRNIADRGERVWGRARITSTGVTAEIIDISYGRVAAVTVPRGYNAPPDGRVWVASL